MQTIITTCDICGMQSRRPDGPAVPAADGVWLPDGTYWCGVCLRFARLTLRQVADALLFARDDHPEPAYMIQHRECVSGEFVARVLASKNGI